MYYGSVLYICVYIYIYACMFACTYAFSSIMLNYSKLPVLQSMWECTILFRWHLRRTLNTHSIY